ncbi:hypothetical protein BY457_104187 [Marinilabilia salmonicolor]|jgi:hypothetical protein|uniref:hypothetical protein n=1 Tax=Marinilabilia salmonicolor TaxID=989 RepID=UPI000D04F378|nr:hypothetical protein [Marinilabilia salmonicolor]PRZ00987.1 hypothetical protein BY457_104187 [Marinilabilia salmonicolor]
MYQKIVFPLLLFLFLFQGISAQYYSSGADPASIRWQKIDHDKFKLVFPEEFSKPARELAIFMDSIIPSIEATLNHSPGKIDILIHSHSTFTNGFVSWAPKRIELYPNPSQSNYSTDWLQQLAVHEYRHIVQIDKLNQGFTKVASWLTGQQAVGAALGAYLPMWFIEGDAVITETTLSQSGRGRLPVFTQPLRARISGFGPDSYDKAYLGSYKDFVPDYYKMGYHLTAEVRNRYGAGIWENVIDNVGKNSWSLIPFRRSLRKTGHNSPNELYKSVYDSIANEWGKYEDTINLTKQTPVASSEGTHTDFQFPVITRKGQLFAEMSGPGIRKQIVALHPPKKPKTLSYTGYRDEDPITANERWVAWSETMPHIRWPNADHSVIRIYDLENEKTQTLTHKSRYFAPALASQSDTLAVVETTKSYEFFITLIDLNTGKTFERIPTPDNAFPIHPSWGDVRGELVMVLLQDNKKSIVSLNTFEKTWKTLRAPALDEPKYPQKSRNNLWFAASTIHSEEIFCLNLKNNTTRQVTQSKFGATSPTVIPSDSSLYYAHYTPMGYEITKTNKFQTLKKNIQPSSLNSPLVKKLTNQEPVEVNINNNFNPEIDDYSKWNLLNLHSWAPAYTNIDNRELYPGLTLMSQNLLGTAVARVAYNAAGSKSREKFNAGFTYRGWFPIIDFDVKWGDFNGTFNDIYIGQDNLFTIEQIGKENHIKVETGIRVPLDLSAGEWSRLIQPRAGLSWQNISNRVYQQNIIEVLPGDQYYETGETNVIEYPELDYWAIDYSLYFHNKQRGTYRDVNTRWGQALSFIYKHTPAGNYNSGEAVAASGKLYLPGIGRHDALTIGGGWQKRSNGDEIATSLPYRTFQRFGDAIALPRGYNNIYNDQLFVLNTTYQMPLWNPDWSLSGIAYIKRFRLNLFLDAARTNYQLSFIESGQTQTYRDTYTTSGIELMTDLHLFRFVLPFSIGYRGGWREANNTFFHEAVFSTSFDSFLVNNRKK